jgi:glycolate dehydrogenase FAD-binding subunit
MGDVARPADDAAVAEVLREAAAAGRQVVARGGGTKPGYGLPAPEDALVLETTELASAVALEHGDFVCVVQAGMPLAALQEALAEDREHRQRLMLDPPHGEAQTIGGIVAANASGPLRHRYGAPRDLVLGVRFVTGDGTAARAGGRVVKNVAGYDLAKVLCGSLGSLAVLTEIALKLHPLPAATATVVLEDATPATAAAFVSALRTAPVAAGAVEAAWPERIVAVRIEAASASSAAEQARHACSVAAGARTLAEDDADALWRDHARRPWDGDGVVAGVGVPPAALAPLVAVAERHSASLALRAAVGVGEVRLPGDADAVLAFRAAVEALGGHVLLHRAPPDLARRALPSHDPVALELMRAVKHRLDPHGTLPHRLFTPALAGAGA